jgi:hypothetical protein
MPSRLPKNAKPRAAVRRGNRPEGWTLLPPKCTLRAPAWPLDQPSAAEKALWLRLWSGPIGAWWHDQHVEPGLVASYARLALEKPGHAGTLALARELGLTPAAMLRMRLVVEEPEPEPEPGPDPYAHLAKGEK